MNEDEYDYKEVASEEDEEWVDLEDEDEVSEAIVPKPTAAPIVRRPDPMPTTIEFHHHDGPSTGQIVTGVVVGGLILGALGAMFGGGGRRRG